MFIHLWYDKYGYTRVPSLLGVASLLGSMICTVIVWTLQLDATVTAVATASPPILALCFWALMFVLQRKHFRLHTRALDDANRREPSADTGEYRALAVKMHMGDEAVESLDWLGRARLDSRDAFYIEFRILDESFEPLGERKEGRNEGEGEVQYLSRSLDIEYTIEVRIAPADRRLALFSAGAFFCSDWGLLVGGIGLDSARCLRHVAEQQAGAFFVCAQVGVGLALMVSPGKKALDPQKTAMGKKRRKDDEEAEGEGQEQPAPDAGGGKKTKQKVIHVQDLTDTKLEEREKELAEELRKARLNQGNLRGDPPANNRILWQRQVTYANNAVHRAEQAHQEVRREIEKRRFRR
ncbi:unnamed protein product [Symbiodinium microadriaticum]|nr:unnamed protein product [Symbiodinium microadriaticum]